MLLPVSNPFGKRKLEPNPRPGLLDPPLSSIQIQLGRAPIPVVGGLTPGVGLRAESGWIFHTPLQPAPTSQPELDPC